MSELALFKGMLRRAKISFDECKMGGRSIVTIEAGYCGFVSEIAFDAKTKKLLTIGAYE